MYKKVLFITIVIFVIIFSAIVFGYRSIQDRIPQTSKQITTDNFKLTYTYEGSSLWKYVVTGTLPTPCVSVVTDALVMESYPEQVKVRVKRQESSSTDVCITVIKDYSYSGTFNASSKATVSLVVE